MELALELPVGQLPPLLAGGEWAAEGAAAAVAHAEEAAGGTIGPLTWACGACTFENALVLRDCEICETRRPG